MLADGIVDVLKAQGIATFGPSKAASQIESSKAFAKDFMARHKIPTSIYKTFKGKESLQAALTYVDEAPFQNNDNNDNNNDDDDNDKDTDI